MPAAKMTPMRRAIVKVVAGRMKGTLLGLAEADGRRHNL